MKKFLHLILCSLIGSTTTLASDMGIPDLEDIKDCILETPYTSPIWYDPEG